MKKLLFAMVLGLLLSGCATTIPQVERRVAYPAKGQDQSQIQRDEQECMSWAEGKVPDIRNKDRIDTIHRIFGGDMNQADDIQRKFDNAYGACMEAKGYVVK